MSIELATATPGAVILSPAVDPFFHQDQHIIRQRHFPYPVLLALQKRQLLLIKINIKYLDTCNDHTLNSFFRGSVNAFSFHCPMAEIFPSYAG